MVLIDTNAISEARKDDRAGVVAASKRSSSQRHGHRLLDAGERPLRDR